MNSANEMNVEFDSVAKNESFARVIVASFITSTNPTLEEVSDIKTAVSEAVTNAIIHGYEKGAGKIWIRTVVEDRSVYIEVRDKGIGIADVKQAMEPFSQQNRKRNDLVWGFPLWRHLWIGWRLNLPQAKVPW